MNDWLVSIGLEQLCPLFSDNAINGDVLLNLSLDDLDYLSITALGHRKRILKGIELLRDPTISVPKLPAIAVAASLSAVGVARTTDSTPSVKHWSHIEPISSHSVSSSQALPAKSMKSSEDLDEAAEQAAFTKAVMEWRNGGSSLVSKTSGDNTLSISEKPKNPQIFASKGTVVSESLEGFSKKDSLWHNPFASESSSLADIGEEKELVVQPLSARGESSLLDDVLDEAKEHEVQQSVGCKKQ